MAKKGKSFRGVRGKGKRRCYCYFCIGTPKEEYQKKKNMQDIINELKEFETTNRLDSGLDHLFDSIEDLLSKSSVN